MSVHIEPVINPLPRKPRRWPVALLVAFLNSFVGGALGLPVALWAMEILDASHFEGSSDFAVAFLWTPLAIISGFIVGFIGSFFVRRTGFAGFALRQGIAAGAIATLVALAGGIAYAKADHPPHIQGKRIEVAFELRVPTRGRSVDELESARESPFEIRFMAGESFTSYAYPQWSKAERNEEFITLLIRGKLHSQDPKRVLTAGVSGESKQVFTVHVAASPQKIDEAWSPWVPAETREDGSELLPDDRYWIHYRVRFMEK